LEAFSYEVPEGWAERAHADASKYREMYAFSSSNPDGFWDYHGKRIEWIKPYTKVKNTSFDPGKVSIKWFEDGTTNVSMNCIDRHLAKRADQTAIIWEGDSPNDSKRVTYRQLHEHVCRLANVLKSHGVAKGDTVTLEAEMLLVAVGRMAYLEGLGLENTKVKVSERGTVEVNEYCETAEPGIFAIGDVIPTAQLAHLASKEGILVVEKIAGKKVEPIKHNLVPNCTYCDPEVASVGLTEEKAKAPEDKTKDDKAKDEKAKTEDKAKVEESKPEEPAKKPVTSLNLAIKLALMADPQLFPLDIEVEMEKGKATLTGSVPTEDEKARAGEIAGKIEGVDSVANKLSVTPTLRDKLAKKQDESIAHVVRDRLSRSETLKAVGFDVKSENGIVYLSGKTRFQVIALEAAEAARQVPGVRAVDTAGVQLVAKD